MTTSFATCCIRFKNMYKQQGRYAAIRWARNQGCSLSETLMLVRYFA